MAKYRGHRRAGDGREILIRPARFPAGGAGQVVLPDGSQVPWTSSGTEVWVLIHKHRRGVITEPGAPPEPFNIPEVAP